MLIKLSCKKIAVRVPTAIVIDVHIDTGEEVDNLETRATYTRTLGFGSEEVGTVT